MLKSSLLDLLQHFSVYDRNRFRKFLLSPYHNQREDVLALFNYIDQHLDKSRHQLHAPLVFSKIYEGSPYDEKKFRYLSSFLLQLVESFLVHEGLRKDTLQQHRYLLAGYSSFKIEKGFEKSLRKTRQMQSQSPKSEQDYFAIYHTELENYLFRAGLKRNRPSNLPELNKLLDEAFLVSRLKQSSLLIAHRAVYWEDEDPTMLRLLLHFVGNSSYKDHPLIGAYYYYLMSVEKGDEVGYYQKLKTCVRSPELPLEEKHPLLLLAINYGIKQINLGKTEYLKEVFELYRAGLEENLLVRDGYLSHFAFKNIVGIALHAKQFDWVEHFILTYQNKLLDTYRENYVHFCLSKLRYEQERYQEAMSRLQMVQYNDLFLNLDAKIILIKIYWALKEEEALESALSSLRRFIYRKKELGYHRETYLQFLSFVRKLSECNPYDKEARIMLKKEISEAPALTEKEWLYHQLGD